MRPWAQSSSLANLLAAAREELRPGSLEFACHAAVPVALDPGFVHLLRVNFFVDPPLALPYEAEAEFLLSPLVRELGDGLYEVPPELRAYLLEGLAARYGQDRLTRVAVLLEQYTDRTFAWQQQPELEHAQLLTALTLVDPAAAASWLELAESAGGTSVELGREWFVAMRHRLQDSAPSGVLEQSLNEILPQLTDTSSQVRVSAINRLGELALLPGSDLARISRTLSDHAGSGLDSSPAAASVLDAIIRLVPPPIDETTTDDPVRDVLARLPLLTDVIDIGDPAKFERRPRATTSIPIVIGLYRDLEGLLDLEGGNLLVEGDSFPGRRELLRTMILGLASTRGASQLGFLLIDLCSGQTFDGLGGLPHVANLIVVNPQDTEALNELGQAITAEVQRRESFGSDHTLAIFLASDDSLDSVLSGAAQLRDALLAIDRMLGTISVQTIVSARSARVEGSNGLLPGATWIVVSEDPYPWHTKVMRVREYSLEPFVVTVATASQPFHPPAPTSDWDKVLGRAVPQPTIAEALVSRMSSEPKAEPILLPPITDPPTLGEILGPLSAGQSGLHAPSWADKKWQTPIGWLVRAIERERAPMTVDVRDGLTIVDDSEDQNLLLTVILSLAMTLTPDELSITCFVDPGSWLSLLGDVPHMLKVFRGSVSKNAETASSFLLGAKDSAARRVTLAAVVDRWEELPAAIQESLIRLATDSGTVLLIVTSRPNRFPVGNVLSMETAGRWWTSDRHRFVPALPALRKGESITGLVERIRAASPLSPVPTTRETGRAAVPGIPGLTELSLLGVGGYATIFRGRQPGVGRDVAVKVENFTLDSERDRTRFVREARSVGKMSSHPHIVDLFDAGVTSDGHPYLIMELCAGSYADLMPLQPVVVRDIGIKIADALADAHERGIVHRDVKPANILVSLFGEPALTDFGLPIFAEQRDPHVTLEVMTPAYAPPEAFRRAEPAPPGDVYSLCATLYALLTGAPPRWQRNQPPGILALLELFAEPIPEIEGVPEQLAQILRLGMANDPAERPTARALEEMLAAVDLTQSYEPPSAMPGTPVVGKPLRGIAGFFRGLLGGRTETG